MFMHDVKKSSWLNKKAKIIGRGNGSGKGNYSTRGLKGQKSRTGHSTPLRFEGGQTPLSLRLPKMKGFKRFFKHTTIYDVINLGRLEKDNRVKTGMTITKDMLRERRYCKKDHHVKVLGNGDLTKKLVFQGIDFFSQSAQQKIEQQGWSVK